MDLVRAFSETYAPGWYPASYPLWIHVKTNFGIWFCTDFLIYFCWIIYYWKVWSNRLLHRSRQAFLAPKQVKNNFWPEPQIINLEPWTLSTEPWALNPKFSTLNPQPWILNPEPEPIQWLKVDCFEEGDSKSCDYTFKSCDYTFGVEGWGFTGLNGMKLG